MTELRIAHIAPYYFPSIGGVEYAVQLLAEGLADRGHAVDILTSRRSNQRHKLGRMHPSERIGAVDVYRYRSLLHVGHMSFFPGIWTRLARERYHIVHLHSLRHPHTIIGALGGTTHGAAVVLQGHSHFVAKRAPKNFLYRLFDTVAFPTLYRQLSAVVALTDSEKRGFVRRGVDAARVVVIPNAVQERFFHFRDPRPFQIKHRILGRRVLLFLGRIVPDKRIDLIIRALPDIRKRVPDVVFVAAGPQQEDCRRYAKMAADLEVQDHVRFIGELDDEEKSQALRAMDVFIIASDYEAFGLGIAEAMAAGKPVVATRTPGPIEIVQEGVHGFLIERGAWSAIAEKTILLLEDRLLAGKLGEQCRRCALERFDPRGVITQIEALYEKVLAERLAPGFRACARQ